MHNIDFSNYSLDALILMKADIDRAIDDKNNEKYKTMVGKVLDALKAMAENFPYTEAITYIGGAEVSCDWEDVYSAFLDENRS